MSDPTSDGLGTLIVILFVYFVPWMVAIGKWHRHAGAIFVLNLLLGWTVLGWIIALIWAAMNQPRERPAPRVAPPPPAPAEDGPAPTGDVTLDLRAPWRRYPSLERYHEETEAEEARRGKNRRLSR